MKCKIINNEVYERRVFFSNRMISEGHSPFTTEVASYVDLFYRSELGEYIKTHAVDLEWHKTEDFASYTHTIALTGYMRPQNITFMKLKFSYALDKYNSDTVY